MAWAAIREVLLFLALAPLVYYLLAIIAAEKFFRRPISPPSDFLPPVSILKPIRGLDREAYENFASFCRQDYPQFEILFCVTDKLDPTVPVIKQLIHDFPQCAIRLLVGSEPLGVSDKVNKLCRMVGEARHDILIIGDSDVRVESGYLRAIAAPFRDPQVGAATCLYRGLTDGSFAADLEALGNSTDFAPGVLVAWLFGGVNFALGATMATTKRHLAEIGGFEALVDYFSDDYELGNRIAARGYRVELSRFPVSVVYPRQILRDTFRHQLRWNLSIRTSRPAGHLGMIFAQGLPWMVLGFFLVQTEFRLAIFLGVYALLRGDVALSVGARGLRDKLVRSKPWMLPLRDAFAFIVWVASFFPQRIHWRDQEFYVRGKRLVSIAPRSPRD
jgi:ceramide glucosyltransferase